jgi:hypothetical protein
VLLMGVPLALLVTPLLYAAGLFVADITSRPFLETFSLGCSDFHPPRCLPQPTAIAPMCKSRSSLNCIT